MWCHLLLFGHLKSSYLLVVVWMEICTTLFISSILRTLQTKIFNFIDYSEFWLTKTFLLYKIIIKQ
jgi:hypothetical protein